MTTSDDGLEQSRNTSQPSPPTNDDAGPQSPRQSERTLDDPTPDGGHDLSAVAGTPVGGERLDAGHGTTGSHSRLRRTLKWVGIAVGSVLAVLLGLAIWPASTSGLSSEPDPTVGYDSAVERFEQLTGDESATVFEPCESILLDHGRRTEVAVVLFHGLTNCPEQFKEFADEVHATGANVVVMRAPRHGLANDSGDAIGGLSQIDGLTAKELADFADDAVDIGVGLGDDVRVLGLSMGGVLSIWAAQERPDIDRVVAVAPAMSIPRVPRLLTSGFINLFDKLPAIDLPGESDLDHAYVGESTKGLVATFTLSRSVENAAGVGPAADEVIVVVNPDDNQVDLGYVTSFAASWGDDGEVTIVELPFRGLRHDVIDPDQSAEDVQDVYPFLIKLLTD